MGSNPTSRTKTSCGDSALDFDEVSSVMARDLDRPRPLEKNSWKIVVFEAEEAENDCTGLRITLEDGFSAAATHLLWK